MLKKINCLHFFQIKICLLFIKLKIYSFKKTDNEKKINHQQQKQIFFSNLTYFFFLQYDTSEIYMGCLLLVQNRMQSSHQSSGTIEIEEQHNIVQIFFFLSDSVYIFCSNRIFIQSKI